MNAPRVIALSGGVGGAKLADGLYRTLESGALAVVVNSGDDFRHLGLPISPDIDTILYTLAGVADPERGWGRANETWGFMDALRELGGPDWFQLGDRDLAIHVWRGAALAEGQTLSGVTALAAERLGIQAAIWPMSDQPVATLVDTDAGLLAFQDYFVARRCAPALQAVRFEGAADALPCPALSRAVSNGKLQTIIICPSNPWLSIDPIIAVPGMRDLLRSAGVPIVAVSPLIAGQAVKGPTAKIMAELGLPLSNGAIARHYRELIDGLIIDGEDDAEGVEVPVHRTSTLMRSTEDRVRLAQEAIAFAARLSRQDAR